MESVSRNMRARITNGGTSRGISESKSPNDCKMFIVEVISQEKK